MGSLLNPSFQREGAVLYCDSRKNHGCGRYRAALDVRFIQREWQRHGHGEKNARGGEHART